MSTNLLNIFFYLEHNMASDEYCGKPYKIIDSKREHKIGIVASSLSDFITKGKQEVFQYFYNFNFYFYLIL